MTAPEVSVLLPFYNAESTLAEAIDSVLAQRNVDFELILIDDGSSDDSPQLARRYLNDHRVRLVSHPNMGLAASLNAGLEQVSAPLTARMDADDRCHPDRLRTQCDYLQRHPSTAMVGGQINRYVDGTVDSRSYFPLDHDDIVRLLLTGGHAISHPTIVFRTEAARSVGGYWRSGVAEDWDFYLKIAEYAQVANVPEVVLDYRFHSGGINAESMRRVRTNIALAATNHRRRMDGRPELTPEEFTNQLSFRERLRISAETRSLSAYRRALTASGGRRIFWLATASAAQPRFAARRVLSGVRRQLTK